MALSLSSSYASVGPLHQKLLAVTGLHGLGGFSGLRGLMALGVLRQGWGCRVDDRAEAGVRQVEVRWWKAQKAVGRAGTRVESRVMLAECPEGKTDEQGQEYEEEGYGDKSGGSGDVRW